MVGRIWAQTVLLLCEGIAVLIFANCRTLSGSILVLVVFSLFVQAAEGSSYGIVPYVNQEYMGSISGIVGAGGNVGAVAFGMCFRQLENDFLALYIMGVTILVSAGLSICFHIEGHDSFLQWLSKLDVFAVPQEQVHVKKATVQIDDFNEIVA